MKMTEIHFHFQSGPDYQRSSDEEELKENESIPEPSKAYRYIPMSPKTDSSAESPGQFSPFSEYDNVWKQEFTDEALKSESRPQQPTPPLLRAVKRKLETTAISPASPDPQEKKMAHSYEQSPEIHMDTSTPYIPTEKTLPSPEKGKEAEVTTKRRGACNSADHIPLLIQLQQAYMGKSKQPNNGETSTRDPRRPPLVFKFRRQVSASDPMVSSFIADPIVDGENDSRDSGYTSLEQSPKN